jgi:hypothetical protein
MVSWHDGSMTAAQLSGKAMPQDIQDVRHVLVGQTQTVERAVSPAKNILLFSTIYHTVLMSPARVISPFFVLTTTGSWRMSRYTRAGATIWHRE